MIWSWTSFLREKAGKVGKLCAIFCGSRETGHLYEMGIPEQPEKKILRQFFVGKMNASVELIQHLAHRNKQPLKIHFE